ncbi:hypothetical protein Tsubulata_004745 [Turnera subulata]|uniref:Dihydropteroate synthase n=1 Tax=Turnera subulata TaxID=218843 RepID=A0A9Q0J820_9ROSI|nr:hypothetical protein Tsubulata_004745 [Turnera subulata]
MAHVLEKKFPLSAQDYKLYEEVGEGVSATVYRALCVPLNEIVAIKVLDLEKCNNDLDGIRREVQTMSLIDHPNVLRAHCSFTAGHNLWVVMPYMAGGSCLHIMKSAYPEGFEEPVIATLLRETLKALVYLHAHGHIHRDVKAGNILIDNNGTVKLADFGVSACMFDTGDRQRSRNTFVGTPCWMAPEVMQQLHGYDFKADIWSLGITALELAHGHAPFSKYPPMKVLLMTLQNAPPGLDYERDKRFSKSFKELVAACLVKDPKKRPSSEKLLKHHFFKHARAPEYLARTILDGLSPLGDRFRTLKAKEADLLLQNKNLYDDKEHLSQKEYIRGISEWNFNLEDLKRQAALIQDDDCISNVEVPGISGNQKENHSVEFQADRLSAESVNNSSTAPSHEDGFNDLHDLESSLASFPIKPLQALKGCFDIGEDDGDATSPNWQGTSQTDSEQQVVTKFSPGLMNQGRNEGENSSYGSYLPRQVLPEPKKFLSGSLVPDNAKKIIGDENRDFLQPKYQSDRNYSGTLLYRSKKDGNNLSSVEDTSEGAVVRKGRFKVTSAELSPKGPTNCYSSPVSGVFGNPTTSNLTPASILPSLQCILQQNSMQRDEILKLMKYVEQSSGGKQVESGDGATNDLMQNSLGSVRERNLQAQLISLQQSVGSIAEELQRQKIKNVQILAERSANQFGFLQLQQPEHYRALRSLRLLYARSHVLLSNHSVFRDMNLFKRLAPTKRRIAGGAVNHLRGSYFGCPFSTLDSSVEVHSQEHQVVIAIGSNVGNRVANFNEALKQMKKSGVNITRHACLYETAPAYVTDQPHFLNSAVRAVTKLGPHELLRVLKSIEKGMGRTNGIRYGPRPIDLDILFYGKLRVGSDLLTVPHERIWERPFVMAPLVDLLGLDADDDTVACWHSLSKHSGSLFKSWEKLGGERNVGKEGMRRVLPVGNRLWDWSQNTSVMGILNLTPDSFSDGGRFLSVEAAVSQVRSMISEGADIIDFGAQSTRPMASRISPQQELDRLLPVLEAVVKMPEMDGKLISIDTFYSQVALEAVSKGAHLINDVSAGQLDPDMINVVARLEVPYVAMHMRGDPTTMQNDENLQYDDVCKQVASELYARVSDAELAGIPAWRIIIDPGIGFSKKTEHNLDILMGLPTIRAEIARRSLAVSHLPILVGPSRKRFLGEICGRPAAIERDPASIASVTACVLGGANLVRVHNVRDNADGVKLCDAILKHKSSSS